MQNATTNTTFETASTPTATALDQHGHSYRQLKMLVTGLECSQRSERVSGATPNRPGWLPVDLVLAVHCMNVNCPSGCCNTPPARPVLVEASLHNCGNPFKQHRDVRNECDGFDESQ